MLKIVLGLFLIINTAYADTIKSVFIKEHNSAYVIDIEYPQGFSETKVNKVITSYIAEVQQNFLAELSEDEDTPADATGTTGLNVIYSIAYNAKKVLSIRFDVSIYHKGAAHPLNTVVVHNFIEGEPVRLADLFISGTDYLERIALYCSDVITTRKISEAAWIKEGTKPVIDNYSVWFFTDQGISILFNTYQVAAYVYGEQSVAIPLSVISSVAKPEFIKTVWGN